jgi:hypothetical protein
MARHGGNSIEASGSAKFVAAAVVGNAIGNAFIANADFNDCMQASGFVIADGAKAPQPVAYAPPGAVAAAPLPTAPMNAPLAPQTVAFVTPVAGLPPEAAALQDCTQPLRANDYYAPLLPHLPDASGDYTIAQLADTSIPTSDERTIAVSFHDMTRPCVDTFAASVQAALPGSASLVAQAEADQKAALVLLASGRLSWGDYAQHDQKIHDDLKAKMHSAVPL